MRPIIQPLAESEWINEQWVILFKINVNKIEFGLCFPELEVLGERWRIWGCMVHFPTPKRELKERVALPFRIESQVVSCAKQL